MKLCVLLEERGIPPGGLFWGLVGSGHALGVPGVSPAAGAVGRQRLAVKSPWEMNSLL